MLSALALIEYQGRHRRGLEELATLLKDNAENPPTSPTAHRLEHLDISAVDDAAAILGQDEAQGVAIVLALWLRSVLESHGTDPQEWCDAVRRRVLNAE